MCVWRGRANRRRGSIEAASAILGFGRGPADYSPSRLAPFLTRVGAVCRIVKQLELVELGYGRCSLLRRLRLFACSLVRCHCCLLACTHEARRRQVRRGVRESESVVGTRFLLVGCTFTWCHRSASTMAAALERRAASLVLRCCSISPTTTTTTPAAPAACRRNSGTTRPPFSLHSIVTPTALALSLVFILHLCAAAAAAADIASPASVPLASIVVYSSSSSSSTASTASAPSLSPRISSDPSPSQSERRDGVANFDASFCYALRQLDLGLVALTRRPPSSSSSSAYLLQLVRRHQRHRQYAAIDCRHAHSSCCAEGRLVLYSPCTPRAARVRYRTPEHRGTADRLRRPAPSCNSRPPLQR